MLIGSKENTIAFGSSKTLFIGDGTNVIAIGGQADHKLKLTLQISLKVIM